MASIKETAMSYEGGSKMKNIAELNEVSTEIQVEEITKKKGLNFSAAKAEQVRNIALLQLREKEALDVRTRCKNAAAMVKESRKTRRLSESAVSLRTAADKFNITYSQLFRYVSYVGLLYYILFHTEHTVIWFTLTY